ncbi:MAG TPA: hypothetical protein VG347_14170 [Verrucomicrobiae bacterium]|nr:hypothetical protein [Verrucomicrobiae bacterium]
MSRNARFHFVLLALLGWLLPAGAEDFFAPRTTNSAVRVTIAQGANLFDAFLPFDDRVEAIFNRGLTNFTQTTSTVDAWHSLLTNNNETVGIKVFSTPGRLTGTRPAVVIAIVHGLLAAGLSPTNIIIWDKHAADLRNAGYFDLGQTLGVPVIGAADAGYDTNNYYLPDSPVIGSLVWGDVEFGNTNKGVGKKSYLSNLISHRLTKIISVVPLIDENSAGTCGHFFSLALGSVDNTRRFEDSGDRLAVALPELYALPSIGDRVVLNVTDALIGQYQGGPANYLQYSTLLQQLWFSRDPVALDTLALRELGHERQRVDAPQLNSNFEIYTNATLLQLGISNPARIQIETVR